MGHLGCLYMLDDGSGGGSVTNLIDPESVSHLRDLETGRSMRFWIYNAVCES